jgi:hypothetical protein
MAVYVNAVMMVADTEEELVGFARKLGLSDRRLRGDGFLSFYQVDVSERQKALTYGALDAYKYPDEYADCLLSWRLCGEVRFRRINRSK